MRRAASRAASSAGKWAVPTNGRPCAPRLIDRPIRPLFPKGFRDEVQVLASVLSSDQENDPDVLALTGASAALHASRIPFLGPIAGGRVGYIDGNFVLNPTTEMLQKSSMNLVLAASKLGVVMVEGLTQFLPEELVADALVWGREALTPLLDIQEELRNKVGKPKIEVVAPGQNEELRRTVIELAREDLGKALCVPEKMARKEAKKAVKDKTLEAVAGDGRFAEIPNAATEAAEALADLGKEIVRRRIVEQGVRIDGRDLTTVRDISIETGLAAQGPRFGPVRQGGNQGPDRGHPGKRQRRAENGNPHGNRRQALPVPLQLPPLLRG